ncbi:MAG TPA: acetate/propionate family kinase [Candidatus Limnocylindria bacterium]
MRVLVINAGSSSLKLSLVEQPGDERVAEAELDLGADATRATTSGAQLNDALEHVGAGDADAVGHRVVHGGARSAPGIVDDALLAEIERLDELAPLHNRVAAGAIRAARDRMPKLPHVACFDTAFHATLPLAATRYALPAEWVERFGLRRYGFHGLSVAWSVERTAALLDRPAETLGIVVAHLGSGASVTAVQGGRSVATSMGMTPLEGLVMGTRAGSVDPGILVHLLRHGIGLDALEDALAHRGGLLALAGLEGMRAIEAAAEGGDERAEGAIELFVLRAAAEIASAATALERLDALTFTGGIGEGSPLVRQRICRRLGALGIGAVDGAATSGDRLIAAVEPSVAVVHAREDLVIARQVAEVVPNRPT